MRNEIERFKYTSDNLARDLHCALAELVFRIDTDSRIKEFPRIPIVRAIDSVRFIATTRPYRRFSFGFDHLTWKNSRNFIGEVVKSNFGLFTSRYEWN